jgi:hypothetical protein
MRILAGYRTPDIGLFLDIDIRYRLSILALYTRGAAARKGRIRSGSPIPRPARRATKVDPIVTLRAE